MVFPYRIIDLTHTLDSTIPAWNVLCGFNCDIRLDYDDCKGDTKFRVMKIQMHAGIGTHMDSPKHCFSDGRSIDEFDPNDLCMRCFVIDVSHKMHERYSVTLEDVLVFEAEYGMIGEGSCVMIKTGWEKFWNNSEKYRNNHVFPSVSIEAADLLLARGVKALGIDTFSSDRPEGDFKVHKAFLGSGNVLIENVANLDKLPKIGSYVMVFPLKILGATEAPVRLIGLIEKE